MTTPDFAVAGGGTLYNLLPITVAAKDWVREHISDDAPTWVGGVAVEHRYIRDIVDDIQAKQREVA